MLWCQVFHSKLTHFNRLSSSSIPPHRKFCVDAFYMVEYIVFECVRFGTLSILTRLSL